MTAPMAPDWIGVAVHYPDGRTHLLQIDHPRGSLDIETEPIDVTFDQPYRVYTAGHQYARIEFEGYVGNLHERRGPRPDWPTAPAGEITEAPRAIEGSAGE